MSTFNAPNTPQPPIPTRPTTGTVFGVLNLVLGIMGICCSPFSTLSLFIENPQDPVNKLIHDSTLLTSWMIIAAVLGMVLGGILITAGIGLLTDKSFGRKLSIVYSWTNLALIIIGFLISIVWLYIPLINMMSDLKGVELSGAIGGMAGGIFSTLWGAAYPIVLLIFMSRSTVKAWYDKPSM